MVKGHPDPSGTLVALAERVYRWEEAGNLGTTWVDDAEEPLRSWATASLRAGSEIEVETAEAAAALAEAPALVPTFDHFLRLARWLQRLDDWHSPLLRAAGALTELTDLQEVSLQRLQVGGGGYNVQGSLGSLIPAAASGVARPTTEGSGAVAQLLHSTAYLPPATLAGDPDDPSLPSSRTVGLRYVATSMRSGDPRGPIGDRPRIAVAPVLQDIGDASVELRTGPDRYGVRVVYDASRLDNILMEAVAQGAHLLLMPEMAVDAGRRKELASAIRRAVGAHRRLTGKLPELRFVITGLSHADGATGNNSIVIMNSEGREILEQNKLCRWNLKWYHQINYGVRPACTAVSPDLKEDIPGGDLVWITDLVGVGRFLTLICADMDYDKPGDWLIRNVAVDWLHAPIMDKSISFHVGASGVLQPWIVARANRAADNGVPKVVVTNSVLLTLKINEVNAASGSFPVSHDCTIAFMLDKSGTSKSFRQIDVVVPRSTPAPIVTTVTWLDGFALFPPK